MLVKRFTSQCRASLMSWLVEPATSCKGGISDTLAVVYLTHFCITPLQGVGSAVEDRSCPSNCGCESRGVACSYQCKCEGDCNNGPPQRQVSDLLVTSYTQHSSKYSVSLSVVLICRIAGLDRPRDYLSFCLFICLSVPHHRLSSRT